MFSYREPGRPLRFPTHNGIKRLRDISSLPVDEIPASAALLHPLLPDGLAGCRGSGPTAQGFSDFHIISQLPSQDLLSKAAGDFLSLLLLPQNAGFPHFPPAHTSVFRDPWVRGSGIAHGEEIGCHYRPPGQKGEHEQASPCPCFGEAGSLPALPHASLLSMGLLQSRVRGWRVPGEGPCPGAAVSLAIPSPLSQQEPSPGVPGAGGRGSFSCPAPRFGCQQSLRALGRAMGVRFGAARRGFWRGGCLGDTPWGVGRFAPCQL